jgi:hypothetical protein
MTAGDEGHRLKQLAAAVNAATSHAVALSNTFAALGSQLTATISSLTCAFELMTPQEKAQALTASLGVQLESVIERLEGLRKFAGKPLNTESGSRVSERVN